MIPGDIVVQLFPEFLNVTDPGLIGRLEQQSEFRIVL